MVDRHSKKPNEKLMLLAAELGHTFILSAFLEHPDININLKNKYGQTALSLAAGNGHTEIVQQLLARQDVDVNVQDFHGQTALGQAVFYGHITVVVTLLGTPEVRVDILNVEGKTPLSWAIIRKQGIVLGLLLNRMGLPCDKKTRQTLLNRGGGLATTKTGNVLPSYKAWQSPL
jgi:ankyrin repeat protein